MPVTFGPVELGIIAMLPLLCGGSILLALIAIFVRLGRKQPASTPGDKPPV